MSEQTINRARSGGTVTRKKSLYASKRGLNHRQMSEGLDLLQTWAKRSLPPQQKFGRAMIGHAADVARVYAEDMEPGDALPILEEFLMALRGPYGREHVTMPHLPRWVTERYHKDAQPWANTILDMVYTLVDDPESQSMLRAQWDPVA